MSALRAPEPPTPRSSSGTEPVWSNRSGTGTSDLVAPTPVIRHRIPSLCLVGGRAESVGDVLPAALADQCREHSAADELPHDLVDSPEPPTPVTPERPDPPWYGTSCAWDKEDSTGPGLLPQSLRKLCGGRGSGAAGRRTSRRERTPPVEHLLPPRRHHRYVDRVARRRGDLVPPAVLADGAQLAVRRGGLGGARVPKKFQNPSAGSPRCGGAGADPPVIAVADGQGHAWI